MPLHSMHHMAVDKLRLEPCSSDQHHVYVALTWTIEHSNPSS